MIDITPTFLYEYSNIYRGIPEGYNTNLYIPLVKRNGKKIEIDYKDKSFLPNPMFPIELFEYRRGSNIKLSIDGEVISKFAESNFNIIYKNKDMKFINTKMIDLCRQYMRNDLEKNLIREIQYFETTEEADDKKSLEYHYNLLETVRSFNDYLCIVFLHISNILTYPNETFYEKLGKLDIIIKPDDAMKIANKICKRMQEEFEEVVFVNNPIRETVQRITKVEKNIETEFDTDEIIPKDINIKKSKSRLVKPEKQEKK